MGERTPRSAGRLEPACSQSADRHDVRDDPFHTDRLRYTGRAGVISNAPFEIFNLLRLNVLGIDDAKERFTPARLRVCDVP